MKLYISTGLSLPYRLSVSETIDSISFLVSKLERAKAGFVITLVHMLKSFLSCMGTGFVQK